MKRQPVRENRLQFNKLGRRYGSHWALDDATGELRAGEVVSLRGDNGSGKSTLLLTLAGILKPHRGTIHRAPGSRIHLVAHHPMAYVQLSVHENLRHAAALASVEKHGIAGAMDFWQITNLADKPLSTLSRGQLQRFLLARAMLTRENILLLDEPFTGLDERGAALLAHFMRDAAVAGAAILFSEHDTGRARNLAHRSIRMQGGCLA